MGGARRSAARSLALHYTRIGCLTPRPASGSLRPEASLVQVGPYDVGAECIALLVRH